MKQIIIALALVLAFATPAAAEWWLDRAVLGQTIPASPFSLSGSSPATLTPIADLPSGFNFRGAEARPAYALSFTHDGMTFGGPVAEGDFETGAGNFVVPSPLGPFPSPSNTTGEFTLAGDTFAVTVRGGGNNFFDFTGTGRHVVSASEPSLLLLVAVGLGAVGWRRRRRG